MATQGSSTASGRARGTRRPSADGATKRTGSAQQSRPGPADVASKVAEQLQQLTGKPTEGVTSLQRTDDGWEVQVEVLESRRIPDSADILALYEVEADSSAELVGYKRTARYSRGQASRVSEQ